MSLISCKTKKTALKNPDSLSNGTNDSKEITELKFGNSYISACSERMKGNYKDALVFLEECKKINPTNAALNFELATIYKLTKANEQALYHAKIAAQTEPKNEWYQLLLIDCYNQNKQYAQAIKVREVLVKNFPTKSEFKEDLAIDYAIVGQYDKSFKIYEELEKSYGISEQLSLNKVKLLKSQKKSKEAEAELLKLSESNKNETRYYSYLAEFYMEQSEVEKAKSMYDNILSHNPKDPSIHLALHDYYEFKQQHAEAFAYLKKAFENSDLEVAVKANILSEYYKRAEQGQAEALEKGTELAKIFITLHPKATEANALYADFLRLQHQPKEAALYYYIAAINEKRDFRVWENLLFIDNELLHYDSLEHHSFMAMELFPNQPANYLYNGVANAQLKKYKKAERSLKDGLELVISNKAMMLDFLSSLGDAYYNLNEFQKSDKAFEDALKIDSDNTYVLNNYAYYLSLRNENLDKAEKLSKRTLELKPNDRNYLDTYGWILFQQKKYTEAETYLFRASQLGSKNPNIIEHYGDALFKTNKKEEAFLQWNAAKQAGGNSETLLKKIKDKKLNE